MNLTALGIDWAKTSFSLVGMDQHGKVLLRKTLKRHQVLPIITQRQPCLSATQPSHQAVLQKISRSGEAQEGSDCGLYV